jgi:cation transport ATPase
MPSPLSKQDANEEPVAEPASVEAMPYEPSLPCASCRRGVDPLRARAVLSSESGFRYFCDRACLDDYRRDKPVQRVSAPPSPVGSPQLGSRGEELAQEVVTVVRPEAALRVFPTWPPWLVLPACALAFWPDGMVRAVCSLALIVALAVVLRAARILEEESGSWGWLLPAAGVLALLAAAARLSDPWLIVAAGLGVVLCWLRELLAEWTQAPVDALLDELAHFVPLRSRVSQLRSSASSAHSSASSAHSPASSTHSSASSTHSSASSTHSSASSTHSSASSTLDAQDADGFETRSSFTQSVRAGEEVLVESGEVVPVDGVVSAGEATLLPYPAARLPVVRGVGDAVLAGARVTQGSVRLTATRVGKARALFRPASFGQDAASGSASVIRTVERLRSPVVVTTGLSLACVLAFSFASSIAHGVAAIGTAFLALPLFSLVRGVRLSFVASSALGASHGIVFRDAAALERAGRVGAAALSAEGTVTYGTCTLLEVSPLGREQDFIELTALAMGAESAAEGHPIAKAIHDYGSQRGIQPAPLRRVAYTRGRGVTALLDGGGALVLGNRLALLNAGVSVAVADREAQLAEALAHTVVFLAVSGRVRGLFVLEDPMRPEARAAVQTLIDLDLEVVLLGGDHRTTLESLARPLDITHIKAELTAEERAQEIARLREAGVVVAVIGRSPADELSLATADIALTLNAAGGVHEGDIAVGSDDLRDAADALLLARRARRSVQGVLNAALGGGLSLVTAGVLSLLHPALILLLAMAIEGWALPSPGRLLRHGQRAFGATRSSASSPGRA